MSELSRERVLATQRKRWEFLLFLYELRENTAAGCIRSMNGFEVAKQIGVTDRGEADRIFSYLKEAGLIKYMSMGPNVCITKYGIDTIEEAIAAPDKKTEHFLPISVIHIAGSVHGSQIQQSTSRSSQAIVISSDVRSQLLAALPELRTFVDVLPSKSDRDAAAADLDTVERQAQSPSPKPGAIRECLASLRSIAEQTGAAAIAAKLTSIMQSAGWL